MVSEPKLLRAPVGAFGVLCLALLLSGPGLALAAPSAWQSEWPNTDFAKTSVDFDEILSGGPPKDGIPSVDDPKFESIEATAELPAQEPVIGLTINGESRAYPLRILTWHEIVNDVVGGTPVAVTYCPLCNSAIVFDRRVDGKATEFGTTGKLRNSDLVMYDRETESWWQQFMGEAIVGQRTGTKLRMIPARLESMEKFRQRHPNGLVLVPNNPRLRAYGANPYVGYDSSSRPYFPVSRMPEGIEPLARVVRVDDQAWSLALLRERGRIEEGGLILTWEAGQASALDSRAIAEGRDVGNVTVQRQGAGTSLQDVPYDVTFAFVFASFHPEGELRR